MEQVNDTALNVLIIAKYDPTFDWVQLTLQEQHYNIVGLVESVDQIWRFLKQNQVDIIVADTSVEGVHNTTWIHKLAMQSSSTLVMVIAMSQEMDFVREAMLSGAQAFLLKPFDLTELSRSIEQVYQLWLKRNALLAEATDEDTSQKSHTIAVFSPKGGSGVTTVSVNLAVAMAQLSEVPILLIDADLYTADVDILLNLFSKLSILDLIQMGQEVDAELLDQVTNEQAGVTILQGDPRLQFIDTPLEPGQMGDLLREIMSLWEGYIIVNTTNGFDRWTIEILDAAESVLLVTSPHLSTLRATRNFLEMAEVNEESGDDKWQVIMNAYQRQKELQMSEVETSLSHTISATISYDGNLTSTSINRGMPLVLSDSKSNIAKEFFALAEHMLTNYPLILPSSSEDLESSNRERVSNETKQSGKRFWQFFSKVTAGIL
jgi:pilus assembly protein CpaE